MPAAAVVAEEILKLAVEWVALAEEEMAAHQPLTQPLDPQIQAVAVAALDQAALVEDHRLFLVRQEAAVLSSSGI